jgi:5-methylcytosine-specific restriction enzyme A
VPELPWGRCIDGCGRQADRGPRCERCRRRRRAEYESTRPSRQARGLDAEYERNRRIVLKRNLVEHDGLCNVCWAASATTVDHIVPREQGGTNDLDNLRAACGPCNYGKRGQRADLRRT